MKDLLSSKVKYALGERIIHVKKCRCINIPKLTRAKNLELLNLSSVQLSYFFHFINKLSA